MAYGKAGSGNEMETGNGNWKWKLETEMGTNNAPFTDAMFCRGEGRACEQGYLFCAL